VLLVVFNNARVLQGLPYGIIHSFDLILSAMMFLIVRHDHTPKNTTKLKFVTSYTLLPIDHTQHKLLMHCQSIVHIQHTRNLIKCFETCQPHWTMNLNKGVHDVHKWKFHLIFTIHFKSKTWFRLQSLNTSYSQF